MVSTCKETVALPTASLYCCLGFDVFAGCRAATLIWSYSGALDMPFACEKDIEH